MRIDEIFADLTEYGVGLVVPGVNTTPDVKADAITRQAAKFGNAVGAKGEVPMMSKDAYRKRKSGMARPSKLAGTLSPLGNGKIG